MNAINSLINPAQLKANLPRHNDAYTLILQLQQSVAEEQAAMTNAWTANALATLGFHSHRLASASLYLGVEGIGLPATALHEQIEQGATQADIAQNWATLQLACEQLQQLSPADLRMRLGEIY